MTRRLSQIVALACVLAAASAAAAGSALAPAAGGGCSTGSLGTSAWIFPVGLSIVPDGALLIADSRQHGVVRLVGGNLKPFAGTCRAGSTGDGGLAIAARFGSPYKCVVQPTGTAYCSDTQYGVIRQITFGGIISTVVSGLSSPKGIALDGSTLYVAENDSNSNRVLSIQVPCATMCATPRLFACGGGWAFSGDGGQAASAGCRNPTDLNVGPDHTLYIADTANNVIRSVGTDGLIHTVVGTGGSGFSGDGGPASAAVMNSPASVAIAPNGDLVVADTRNSRVRRVSSATHVITTIMGTGSPQNLIAPIFSTVPTLQPISYPDSVAVSADGLTVFVSSDADGFVYRDDQSGVPPTPTATAKAIPTANSCDITGDGTVSVLDGVRILQFVAGLRNTCP